MQRDTRTLPTNATSRELPGLSSELSHSSELSSDATENWKSPMEREGKGHHTEMQQPRGMGSVPEHCCEMGKQGWMDGRTMDGWMERWMMDEWIDG